MQEIKQTKNNMEFWVPGESSLLPATRVLRGYLREHVQRFFRTFGCLRRMEAKTVKVKIQQTMKQKLN